MRYAVWAPVAKAQYGMYLAPPKMPPVRTLPGYPAALPLLPAPPLPLCHNDSQRQQKTTNGASPNIAGQMCPAIALIKLDLGTHTHTPRGGTVDYGFTVITHTHYALSPHTYPYSLLNSNQLSLPKCQRIQRTRGRVLDQRGGRSDGRKKRFKP